MANDFIGVRAAIERPKKRRKNLTAVRKALRWGAGTEGG